MSCEHCFYDRSWPDDLSLPLCVASQVESLQSQLEETQNELQSLQFQVCAV